MDYQQYLVSTGLPRGSSSLTGFHTGPRSLPSVFPCGVTSAVDTDVVMTDAPPLIPSRIERATQIYSQRVAPMVEPAFAVAANGLKHGIKRAAEFAIYKPFAIAAQAYIEIKHSTDDGLAIKRFKRLPIARRKKTSLARVTNTLPVQLLKQLPAKEFDWSTDPLSHLGARNHQRARVFMEGIAKSMKNSEYAYFSNINHVLDMRALPQSAMALLQHHDKHAGLSVLLHNHMITFFDKNDPETFKQSGFDLLEKLGDLFSVHRHTYYDGGRIPSYKMLHLKPTGPIEIPYEEHGTLAHYERLKLMNCINTIQFILAERNCFNQTFPVHTFAGMIADLDAIRKDQLPPSYIDWPGKAQLHMPGRYPETEMENMLFDTINFKDYKIDRMWDEWHPSPGKEVTTADYRTPLRKAMQKNELIHDNKGQAQPRKGALKKKLTDWKAIEERCELEITEDADKRLDIDMKTPQKRGASFIDSPIAFYVPPTNVPVKLGASKKHTAAKTPIASKLSAQASFLHPEQLPEDAEMTKPVEAIKAKQPNENVQPIEDAQPIQDAQQTQNAQPIIQDAPHIPDAQSNQDLRGIPVVKDAQFSVPQISVDDTAQHQGIAQHTGVIQTADITQQTASDTPSACVVQQDTNVVSNTDVAQSKVQPEQNKRQTISKTSIPHSAWGKSIWHASRPSLLVIAFVPSPPLNSLVHTFRACLVILMHIR